MFTKNDVLASQKSKSKYEKKLGNKRLQSYHSYVKSLLANSEEITEHEIGLISDAVEYMVYDIEHERFKANSKNRTFYKTVDKMIETCRPYTDVSKLQEHTL